MKKTILLPLCLMGRATVQSALNTTVLGNGNVIQNDFFVVEKWSDTPHWFRAG